MRLWRRIIDKVPAPGPRNVRTMSQLRRLLALNRRLFDLEQTPEGHSLGALYMRAGQLKNARRWIEREIKRDRRSCGEREPPLL
jgi:hypothetical protein